MPQTRGLYDVETKGAVIVAVRKGSPRPKKAHMSDQGDDFSLHQELVAHDQVVNGEVDQKILAPLRDAAHVLDLHVAS